MYKSSTVPVARAAGHPHLWLASLLAPPAAGTCPGDSRWKSRWSTHLVDCFHWHRCQGHGASNTRMVQWDDPQALGACPEQWLGGTIPEIRPNRSANVTHTSPQGRCLSLGMPTLLDRWEDLHILGHLPSNIMHHHRQLLHRLTP